MATIRSYTTIEQSRKLAEILPLESADMHYSKDFDGSWFVDLAEYTSVKIPKYVAKVEEHLLPCWSLASLLEQLDDEIKDEEGNDYNLTIVKESSEYQLSYHDSWGRAEDIETDYYDDMVDACYEMIIKLHELKLL